MNLLIPINNKEYIYLKKDYTKYIKYFLQDHEVQEIFKDLDDPAFYKTDFMGNVPAKNSFSSLLLCWVDWLKLYDMYTNILLLKSFPYLLLWLGIDFRPFIDIKALYPYKSSLMAEEIEELTNYNMLGNYFKEKL